MSISLTFQKKRKFISSWFFKNERNIIFGLALFLVATFSFELGILTGSKDTDKTLIIEKPAVSLAQIKKEAGMVEEGVVAGVETEAVKNDGREKTVSQSQCAFVGSKNSDKYHLPSCSYAKRIKSENIVCFKSKEDAEGRGYTAGCVK